MALQNNDLLIVGRGQRSYTLTYNEVKTEINADVVALVEAEEARATAAETLLQDNIDAEEAARIAGDAAEKARAEAAEGLLQSNIDAGAASAAADVAAEKARAEAAEALLQSNLDAEIVARIDGDAAEKARAEAAEALLQDNIDDEEARAKAAEALLQSNIDAEEARAKAVEQALSDALSQEAIDRANGDAEILGRIDDLVLNDLSNVTVAGATDNQVLYYNEAAQEWQAKVITLSSSLNFSGNIDLTATAPTAAAGELYVNTATSGAVDASFGVAVQTALPNGVSGGEFVAFNGTDWVYVGGIGGGLAYDSFTVDNQTETAGSKGELSYNSSNGTFTFTKVDLESRIPKDLGTLPVLPV